MKILFFNQSFIEYRDGHMWTGPSAGSCWPHTSPGLYSYVPFPFFLANATSYLRAHGFDADMYDMWAYRITDIAFARNAIKFMFNPKMLVIECNTPNIVQLLETAEWCKREIGCKIVLVGPHIHACTDSLLELPYVDHVVAGEYDLACLKIAQGDTRRKITHEYVADIDTANGKPWHPYRDPHVLRNYCDPSMISTPTQLQVNTSRGCNYSCTFCSWPATMYRRRHARKAETVLDEIRQVVAEHDIRSIFFDDEMFNAGDPARLETLARGLKELQIPWSFMGRIDTSKPEQFEMFVECGCVGMRLGLESTHRHLLDRVNKRLDPVKAAETSHWLVTHFRGLHFRFLTMTDLPGETPEEERQDRDYFEQLASLGRAMGNRVDVQYAKCIPLPGTPMWHDLQRAGEGGKMGEFSEYTPLPAAASPLAARLNTYGAVVPLTVGGK